MKWFRSIAFVLSIVCLFSVVGCKRESNPTIGSSDISSVTGNLSESSQEVLSSVVEEPVSSEPSVAESKPEPSVVESKSEPEPEPEPEVSSQPEPSSVAQEPSSVTESPSSQALPSELAGLPTIPFEVGYQEISQGVRVGFENYSSTFILRSKEELDQKYNVETMTGEERAFFERCDEAYFEENAIVCIELIHSAYSDELIKISPIARSEDHLIVNLYYDPLPEGHPAIVKTAFATECIFLSIKQADAQGITRVVCNCNGSAWDEWE